MVACTNSNIFVDAWREQFETFLRVMMSTLAPFTLAKGKGVPFTYPPLRSSGVFRRRERGQFEFYGRRYYTAHLIFTGVKRLVRTNDAQGGITGLTCSSIPPTTHFIDSSPSRPNSDDQPFVLSVRSLSTHEAKRQSEKEDRSPRAIWIPCASRPRYKFVIRSAQIWPTEEHSKRRQQLYLQLVSKISRMHP